MNKHTPGIWYVSDSQDYFGGDTLVVRVNDPYGGIVVAVITKTPNQDANVRLIAAAPELLGIVAELAACEPKEQDDIAIIDRARAILSKVSA